MSSTTPSTTGSGAWAFDSQISHDAVIDVGIVGSDLVGDRLRAAGFDEVDLMPPDILRGKYRDLSRQINRLGDTIMTLNLRGTEDAGACAIAELRLREAYVSQIGEVAAPVAMILHCPECGGRHVDQGEFATKPHHTHACQHCGLPWRPALVATVGVQFLPGFKD